MKDFNIPMYAARKTFSKVQSSNFAKVDEQQFFTAHGRYIVCSQGSWHFDNRLLPDTQGLFGDLFKSKQRQDVTRIRSLMPGQCYLLPNGIYTGSGLAFVFDDLKLYDSSRYTTQLDRVKCVRKDLDVFEDTINMYLSKKMLPAQECNLVLNWIANRKFAMERLTDLLPDYKDDRRANRIDYRMRHADDEALYNDDSALGALVRVGNIAVDVDHSINDYRSSKLIEEIYTNCQ